MYVPVTVCTCNMSELLCLLTRLHLLVSLCVKMISCVFWLQQQCRFSPFHPAPPNAAKLASLCQTVLDYVQLLFYLPFVITQHLKLTHLISTLRS